MKLLAIAALAAATVTAGASTATAELPADCLPADPAVSAPYPVSGVWVFARSTDCAWRDVLQRVHRVGGDKVIMFGPRFDQRQVSAAGVVQKSDEDPNPGDDPLFTSCVLGTLTCYQDAIADVRAAHPGNRVSRVFVYPAFDVFGTALQACRTGGFDKDLVTVDGVTFARLFIDRLAPGDRSCDFSRGRDYDLVLVRTTGYDPVAGLLREASGLGMKAYVGLPTAPAVAGAAWEADAAATPSFYEFSQRVLTDYASRHGTNPAFAGVYQSFETALTGPINSVVTMYRTQHTQVRTLLPGKQVLLSPYWDARKTHPTGQPVAAVAAGVREIVQGDIDIIAPQDSRGTGKVGLFWPYQGNSAVDPRVAPVVQPATTNTAAYYASTADFFRTARQTIDSDHPDVELWVNLEAFEPTPPPSGAQCGTLTTRQRTDKARLDQAITMAGSSGSHLISFMWDPLFTCLAGKSSTLEGEITSGYNRPIVSSAFRFASDSRDGMVVRGFRMSGAKVVLTWYDATWQLRTSTITVATSGWSNPNVGANSDRLPDRMEEVWVPFTWTNLAPDFWVHIKVTNAGNLTSTHTYSLGY
jgi:hypothetical protein